MLDSLALLDAVLLNTGVVPTFNGRQGSSVVDLTFVSESLAPRVLSWTVSGSYTHSDHQAIVFEIEDAGTSTRPSARQSCRWNARTLDGTAEDMASSLMDVIIGPCDASMTKANPRRRRCTGGRQRSLIFDALACGLADSSRDRVAGRTKKPTARTTPPQGVYCAWQSRPVSDGAGDSFAMRSTATHGANHTGLPCRACGARRPGSLAPLS
uniref:Endonuclease/exonuclease/phosphatase domain-containing protein n=1 Tax=Trichogramma kaykai TaxID=54128 RepID=A0ABD2VVC3_9HYME